MRKWLHKFEKSAVSEQICGDIGKHWCHDPLPVGTFPVVEESQNSQGGEATEEPRNVKYCTITYLLSRLQHELKSTEALRESIQNDFKQNKISGLMFSHVNIFVTSGFNR